METKHTLVTLAVSLVSLGAAAVAMAQANDSGLTINAPRILVSDYQASFHFYHDLVGMKCVYGGPKLNFAEFAIGDQTIQVFKRELMPQCETRQRGSDRVMIVFDSKDVDKSFKALSDRGVHFVQRPTDMPTWTSRIALMRDPDGNLIEINGPLLAAVRK